MAQEERPVVAAVTHTRTPHALLAWRWPTAGVGGLHLSLTPLALIAREW